MRKLEGVPWKKFLGVSLKEIRIINTFIEIDNNYKYIDFFFFGSERNLEVLVNIVPEV